MTGMNRLDGKRLSIAEHLRQSIADILTTPIGSRVMRRQYGSLLPNLIDAPLNDATRMQVYAATVMALLQWEPRVRLSRLQLVSGPTPAAATIDIEGTMVDSGASLNMRIPLALGAVT